MSIAVSANAVPSKPPLLAQLYEIDRKAASKYPGAFDDGLGCIGLRLDTELDQSRYPHCTPANCISFASTGGDGTHFGLLADDGQVTDSSPVVVTVPEGFGSENHVIGENLFEFLCLGSLRGYFALAQLAFDWETTIEAYTNPNWLPTKSSHIAAGFLLGQNYRNAFASGEEFVDETATQVLDLLVGTLNLRPWTDKSRFDVLRDKFFGRLVPPTEQLW